MGLASISWNSVRVFSKLCTRLLRVLYHGATHRSMVGLHDRPRFTNPPPMDLHAPHRRSREINCKCLILFAIRLPRRLPFVVAARMNPRTALETRGKA